ncbi:DNA primase family protein [Streptomyces sp. MST-110588]|uniref:DNA primase family protein n=1 Tax=Streptomyces sp. MST-110588 TaxID=2833628 RepID=UPI001F5C5FFF|nr:DNA primase family protein [Streptomyces sp. MST-110588]
MSTPGPLDDVTDGPRRPAAVTKSETHTPAPDATPAPVAADAEVVPAPTHPMAVARHLAPQWEVNGLLTLRHWRGSWMLWQGSHWRELDDQQMRTSLYRQLEDAVYWYLPPRQSEPELRDWAPTGRKVADLMQAIAAVTHLPPTIDPPSWIDPPGHVLSRQAPPPALHTDRGPLVACANGLLRVTDRALMDLTPAFFNLISVPFVYDPHATAPAWLAFLRQVWPDNPEAITALQEWFGYVLSGRTDQQKILLMVGPSRSGKGTIARVLARLVGTGNTAGPTLAGMASNFGLSSLVDKSLAIVADARLSGRDSHQVVERLLTISGEDTIDVDRKYRQVWTGKMPARIVILSNELPNFGDPSGVIARRFIVLNMTVSWLGKEDPHLLDKLLAELPGIFNWALDGLDRLEDTGRLSAPTSSQEAVTTMQDTASPTSAFLRERCDTGPDRSVPVDALWAAWRTWADDAGVPVGSKAVMGRNLQSLVPQMRRSKPRDPTTDKQVPTYVGISLQTDPAAPKRPEPRLTLVQRPPEQPPLCTVCGQPLAPTRPGQTEHPSCATT